MFLFGDKTILSSFIWHVLFISTFTHLHFFCCFLKGGQQNFNVFQPKKMKSSFFRWFLSKQTFKFHLTGFCFKKQLGCIITNRGLHQLWQLLLATKAPGHHHDQPLSRWWDFYRFLNNRNFPFLEKQRIHFFPKTPTAPLFVSIATPYPVKSSVLCWHPVLSWIPQHI